MSYAPPPDVSSPYGAPMGRPSHHKGEAPAGARFYLRRIRINSGGYDSGGAYWGLGAPLFHYQEEDGSGDRDGFMRAMGRNAAKRMLAEMFPGARFFR